MKDISSQVLDMLRAIEGEFHLPYQPQDIYATILSAFQCRCSILVPSSAFRQQALDFISQVAQTATKPQVFSWPQAPTDLQLLTLLGQILASVTYKQNGPYVLMKYSKGIWDVGWSSVSLTARGKVLDVESHEVVAYPFDKFFNLDENEWTTLAEMGRLVARGGEINVTEKKDGTAIIVTNTGTQLLIHTSGDWCNGFIDRAHTLFSQKYPLFYQAVPVGFTFVFELIAPDNRIVVDYGDESAMYLLAMRNLSTGMMESHETLVAFAQSMGLPLPKVYDFSSLAHFLELRKERKDQVEEGWVFRIRLPEQEVMFKLKYEQYFELHHFYDDVSIKRVYNTWLDNKLDDLLPNLSQKSREKALGILQEIVENLKDDDGELDAIVGQITAQYGTEIPFAQVAKAYHGHRLSMYIFARLRGQVISIVQNPPTYGKYMQWRNAEPESVL